MILIKTNNNNKVKNWVWWCMSMIPALGRWKREDQEIEVVLGYRVSFGSAWATWDCVSTKWGGGRRCRSTGSVDLEYIHSEAQRMHRVPSLITPGIFLCLMVSPWTLGLTTNSAGNQQAPAGYKLVPWSQACSVGAGIWTLHPGEYRASALSRCTVSLVPSFSFPGYF